jgi:hypothetical protein
MLLREERIHHDNLAQVGIASVILVVGDRHRDRVILDLPVAGRSPPRHATPVPDASPRRPARARCGLERVGGRAEKRLNASGVDRSKDTSEKFDAKCENARRRHTVAHAAVAEGA